MRLKTNPLFPEFFHNDEPTTNNVQHYRGGYKTIDACLTRQSVDRKADFDPSFS
jgi:hypothetical protein